MVAFGKFMILAVAAVSSTVAAPAPIRRQDSATVTGIVSEGGSPFGSIPSKLLEIGTTLFGGLFGRDLSEDDQNALATLVALSSLQRRQESATVTGIVSEGGSPFGSIPSKLLEIGTTLFGGLFGRDLSEDDQNALATLVALSSLQRRQESATVTGIVSEGGSPFGSIPSKLLEIGTTLFGGLFGRDLSEDDQNTLATLVALSSLQRRQGTIIAAESDGGSPFGSIPSKLAEIFGSFFKRDLSDDDKNALATLVALSSLQGRDVAVTGIESVGGSPFGSIPSKLVEIGTTLLGGLFGRDLSEDDQNALAALMALSSVQRRSQDEDLAKVLFAAAMMNQD